MKTLLLLVVLSLFAPFALALSVPWDSLGGTQAEPVFPGQSIALNGATEWVLRVALPTKQQMHTGRLRITTASENVLDRGAFQWNPVSFELTFGGASTSGETPIRLDPKFWTGASLEWRKTTDYLRVFIVSADGARDSELGFFRESGIDYTHLSLEVSDTTAFGFAQFMVVTPGLSDPSAPEPGIVSFILLGGGVLLVLRRPSQWRGDR